RGAPGAPDRACPHSIPEPPSQEKPTSPTRSPRPGQGRPQPEGSGVEGLVVPVLGQDALAEALEGRPLVGVCEPPPAGVGVEKLDHGGDGRQLAVVEDDDAAAPQQTGAVEPVDHRGREAVAPVDQVQVESVDAETREHVFAAPQLDAQTVAGDAVVVAVADRKSTRLNSSHLVISYAVF